MKTDWFSRIMLLIITLCLLFLVAHVIYIDIAITRGVKELAPVAGEIMFKINRILEEK